MEARNELITDMSSLSPRQESFRSLVVPLLTLPMADPGSVDGKRGESKSEILMDFGEVLGAREELLVDNDKGWFCG